MDVTSEFQKGNLGCKGGFQHVVDIKLLPAELTS